jgi:hypothetical protein
MQRNEREHFDPQNWVPWVGLALVLPAVLVLLVGAFGVYFGWKGAGGRLFAGEGAGSLGITGAAVTMAMALFGLMLAIVGIVRGIRRPVHHTGRSVGIAGFTLEIAVLALGIITLLMLGLIFFL